MIHVLKVMRELEEAKRRKLSRKCRNCGKRKMLSEAELEEDVLCEKCGMPIQKKLKEETRALKVKKER